MNIVETNLKGLYKIENNNIQDNRGAFVKTFNADIFLNSNLNSNFTESFYSISKKNVLRGMHFQKYPHDHAKLVTVADGEILDVSLDIRPTSKTYGQYYSICLSSENATSLYLEKGFAHGFLTLSETAIVLYQVTSVYDKQSDQGIHWDSFGFSWPVINPILSERDDEFIRF